MAKLSLLKSLYRNNGRDFVEETKCSEMALDVTLMQHESNPRSIFRFLNNDMYSALDIDEAVPGARILYEFFIDEYEYEESFDDNNTSILLSLVLNRNLSSKEHELVADVDLLCNYAYKYGDQYLERHMRSEIAENSWHRNMLIPVQICLFCLFASREEQNRYWNQIEDDLNVEINIANAILRRRSHN